MTFFPHNIIRPLDPEVLRTVTLKKKTFNKKLSYQDVFIVTDVFTDTNLMQSFYPFSLHINLLLKPASFHTDLGLASSTKIPDINP